MPEAFQWSQGESNHNLKEGYRPNDSSLAEMDAGLRNPADSPILHHSFLEQQIASAR